MFVCGVFFCFLFLQNVHSSTVTLADTSVCLSLTQQAPLHSPNLVDGFELCSHPQSMEKQTAYFWWEAIHKGIIRPKLNVPLGARTFCSGTRGRGGDTSCQECLCRGCWPQSQRRANGRVGFPPCSQVHHACWGATDRPPPLCVSALPYPPPSPTPAPLLVCVANTFLAHRQLRTRSLPGVESPVIFAKDTSPGCCEFK